MALPEPFFADSALDPETKGFKFSDGLGLCRDLARTLKLGRPISSISLDIPAKGTIQATVKFALTDWDVERIKQIDRVYDLNPALVSETQSVVTAPACPNCKGIESEPASMLNPPGGWFCPGCKRRFWPETSRPRVDPGA